VPLFLSNLDFATLSSPLSVRVKLAIVHPRTGTNVCEESFDYKWEVGGEWKSWGFNALTYLPRLERNQIYSSTAEVNLFLFKATIVALNERNFIS
jgi:hypothetical protein